MIAPCTAWSRPGALAAAVAAIVLAGCVAVPQVEPTRQLLDDAALGLSATRLLTVDEHWWRAFGDDQLDSLIDESLAHNPTLDEAMTRVRQAQAQALARGAGREIGVSVDGQVERQRVSENSQYPPEELGIDPHGGGVYWIGQLGVNLNWNLDFWGRQAQLIKAATLQAQATQFDRAAARLALAGAIAQAYVDLDRSYALADVAARAEAQRQSLLDLAQRRYQAGLDTQVEVKNAQTLLPQARLARLQAENARDVAVHQLAALAGHGADWYARIRRPQLKLDRALPLPTALPVDLLAHRPDVLAAKLRVESSTANRAAAKAAFLPDVSLHAFAGTQAVHFDELFMGDSLTYGVGPALHLPIFDSRTLKAQYLGATAELDNAISGYNAAVLGAVRDVSDQLTRGDSLRAQHQQAIDALNAAEGAYSLAQRRYQSGLTTQLVVLNAETQVLNARRDLVGIDASLVIARVSLLLTLGGSFTPPSDDADSPALSATSPPPARDPGAAS